MKPHQFRLAVVSVMALLLTSSMRVAGPNGLCDVVLRAPLIEEHVFESDYIERPIDRNWTVLDAIVFQAIHERDKMENDTSWVIGRIPIHGSRFGLLLLNSSPECDHSVRYLTLHLFDGCLKMPEWYFLVVNDDHGGVHERTAAFTAENDTLAISVRDGEADEEGVDTVSTRTDWILLTPIVDTLMTQYGFELQE